MDWFKCYNGATTDKKFLRLSKEHDLPVYILAMCWMHFCDHASQQKERGCLYGIDFDDIDFFFGFDEGQACKAYHAFVSKGMISDNKLSKWEDRQKNEAAERQKRYRERQKANEERNDDNSDVTLRNEHNALPEEKRREEKREEEKDTKVSKKLYKKDFEDFYLAYPRKVGKQNAAKAFDQAVKRASIEDIASGLERIITSWSNKDPQYIPHPATWLNRDGWLDEPDQGPHRRPNGGGHMADLLR